jgi:Acyl-CoA dehydrogenase, C-terminal domain
MGAALVPVAYVVSGVLVPELLAAAAAPASLQADVAEGRTIIGLAMRADLTGVATSDDLSDAVLIGTPGYRTVLALAAGSDEVISVAVDDQNLERLDSAELSIPLYRLRDTQGLTLASVGSSPSQEAIDRWLALGLSALSAEMVAAAEAGLRGAIEYSKTREAFGVPIGTFQALQHMAADAYVACEGLRSTNNHASWSVDEEQVPDALLAARVVKAYAGRQMLGVAETAMQMYGGIGQTWEHIAHFYARRVLLNRYLLGDTQLQLAAIADRRLERLSSDHAARRARLDDLVDGQVGGHAVGLEADAEFGGLGGQERGALLLWELLDLRLEEHVGRDRRVHETDLGAGPGQRQVDGAVPVQDHEGQAEGLADDHADRGHGEQRHGLEQGS